MSWTTEPDIVLLVEQDSTTSDRALEALQGTGLQLSVCDEAAAIAQAVQLQPALILLESASGLAAVEACRQFQNNPKTAEIPLLVLLNPEDAEVSLDALCSEAAEVLVKPLYSAVLKSRIQTLRSLQRLRQQVLQQAHQLQREVSHREQLSQSLQDVVYVISHDLRNPVLGMQMVLNNLLNGVAVPNSGDVETIAVPRSTVERMAQGVSCHLSLINAMLEAHAEQDDSLFLQRQPVQLDELVQDVVQDLEPLLQKSRATLALQIDSALPLVHGDRERLRGVVEHLLINALKHNMPGIHLAIELRQQDDALYLSVEDNGVGIAPDQCQRLFGLHQRGGNSKHGLGLGLYLCQRIIQAHGGKIQVASRPAQGARFWFVLPLNSSVPAAIGTVQPCDRPIGVS